jgi:hypothetical protein
MSQGRRLYLLILLLVTGVVIGMLLLLIVTDDAEAEAQSGVDIPLDRVHRGDDGERFLEAEVAATNEIGWTCGAILTRHNNSSIHAEDGHADHGTNLIIESGANSVVFTNIESVAFEEAILAFVIDGDIKVYTQIGEDGVSSMGFRLEFECNPPTTTTSPPERSTTTTTVPVSDTTVPPATTTTEPPPINGVDTGGGALEHLVTSDPTPSSGSNGLILAGLLAMLGAGLFIGWRQLH